MDRPSKPRRSVRIPETLPVLPLRDVTVFPNIIAPLSVSRPKSVEAIEQALAANRIIFLVSQVHHASQFSSSVLKLSLVMTK